MTSKTCEYSYCYCLFVCCFFFIKRDFAGGPELKKMQLDVGSEPTLRLADGQSKKRPRPSFRAKCGGQLQYSFLCPLAARGPLPTLQLGHIAS